MNWTRRKFLMFSGLSPLALVDLKKRNSRVPSLPFKKHASYPKPDVWIELNMDHIGWNLDKIRKRVNLPVMAVIKANAYGHGLILTARSLEKSGIDSLMVCKLEEAIQLRESEVACPILNFGPFFPESAELLVKHQISQSVFTSNVKILSSTAAKMGKTAKIHIHIDTGMGRMGISYQEAFSLISELATLNNLKIQGISTTLTEDDEFDREQIRRLISICRRAQKDGIDLGRKHAASSAAIMSYPDSYLDMVRPGILVYGYYPSEKSQHNDKLALKPVLQLKCRVAAAKTLRPGDSISYHRAYIAKTREKIAVLPIGYSDGYPFNMAGRGFVLLNGERAPIVGSVTANHLEVRLKLDSNVSVGDEAVLIGDQKKENISADELARWAEISTYKILIGLNPLLQRISV
ncbi:MAG: alanine racemase [Candidatus Aminicenantaceae bacterium]